MNVDDFILLGQHAIQTAVLISAPVLVFGLVAGLAISIFQAATQISDPALAFIPKICAAVLGLVFFGHFMINRIAAFTIWTFERIGTISP